jgi:hypothetical protein
MILANGFNSFARGEVRGAGGELAELVRSMALVLQGVGTCVDGSPLGF